MFCVSLGYIDDQCFVHKDIVPRVIRVFDGEVCVVSDTQSCADVHIDAEFFADNPLFTCKVMVGVKYLCLILTKYDTITAAYTLTSPSCRLRERYDYVLMYAITTKVCCP